MVRFYNVPIRQYQAIKGGADFVTDDGRVIPNEWLTLPADAAVSYAYCSDTVYDERVAAAVEGVDTIYHEATYTDEYADKARSRGHSTAAEAARIARLAGANRLVLGHFSKRYIDEAKHLDEAKEIFPNTIIAYEGHVPRFVMIVNDEDRHFMKVAIDEAHRAYEEDEVPIGAVVVSKGRIIGRGHNLTEKLNDVTAHAEMQAITAAANYLGGKYLDDCTLYVTVEPCIMCAGAIGWSQLKRIVYGAPDAKRGFSTFTRHALRFTPSRWSFRESWRTSAPRLCARFFSRKRK